MFFMLLFLRDCLWFFSCFMSRFWVVICVLYFDFCKVFFLILIDVGDVFIIVVVLFLIMFWGKLFLFFFWSIWLCFLLVFFDNCFKMFVGDFLLLLFLIWLRDFLDCVLCVKCMFCMELEGFLLLFFNCLLLVCFRFFVLFVIILGVLKLNVFLIWLIVLDMDVLVMFL